MRFSRTRLLVGDESLERLAQSKVAVFGLGGVGSYAVEALARAGVGTLFLVDFDVVSPSNINRQLLALDSTLGRPKVDVARERIREINPEARVETAQTFVAAENVETILPEDVKCAIDAIDAVSPKVHLIAALHKRGTRSVTCMGAASRLDPARIRVADIAETKGCPLARRIRQRLKKLGISRGVRCVYSEELLNVTEDIAEIGTEEGALERGRKRRVQGSISYVPGIVGLIAAGLIIQDILSADS